MALTRRTVRLEIDRIVFDGIEPGDRRRFERALRTECGRAAARRAARRRFAARRRTRSHAAAARRSGDRCS